MKLKPCPFCNGKPWSDGRVVCCPACAEESYLTVDEWNNRPIEDQQAEQNQRLKELLFACYDDVSQAMQAKIDKERTGQ